MRALCLQEANGPESVRMEEVETPSPATGQVRIALKAAALNHRELFISRGQYPGMSLPTTMGADGAGVIETVGEGVDASLIGKEVVLYPAQDWGDDQRFPTDKFGALGMPGPGTIANYICVPADSVVPKPLHLSFDEAAAIPLAALTAWRALTISGKLQSGETVLITGISGGVATLAMSFALALGAKVYVTSSNDESLGKAKALGASGGFNYKDPDWRKAVGKSTGGIDVVIDGAPGSSVPNYFRALRKGARVVIYGSTGAPSFSTVAPELFLKYVSIIGTAMGSPEDFRAMMSFVEQHQIRPSIDRTFALEEAPEALLYLERSHAFGKVVIRI
ncbi:MAG: zinc-dependent alcohol dehydrogenase family protein [Janthinobacterium lividum]